MVILLTSILISEMLPKRQEILNERQNDIISHHIPSDMHDIDFPRHLIFMPHSSAQVRYGRSKC